MCGGQRTPWRSFCTVQERPRHSSLHQVCSRVLLDFIRQEYASLAQHKEAKPGSGKRDIKLRGIGAPCVVLDVMENDHVGIESLEAVNRRVRKDVRVADVR